MRQSQKQIINKTLPTKISVDSQFDKSELDGALVNRGYSTTFEKSFLCPCKGKSVDHRNTCRNCGGVGYVFVNPTKTRMIITGIHADGKFNQSQFMEWGMIDAGVVTVTALNNDKLSFMDRITLNDATTEHNQVMFPSLTDDETQLFSYTKYDILSIQFIGLFVDVDTPIKKLDQGIDYTWRDNVILFDTQYKDLDEPTVTIRYTHRPMFHIIDILRESMTSKTGSIQTGQQNLLLPIKAIAKRAHLVKDVENYDGDRLLDNSWLPDACESEIESNFVRQLKYTNTQIIYDNLTAFQKTQMDAIINGDTNGVLLLEDGGDVDLE